MRRSAAVVSNILKLFMRRCVAAVLRRSAAVPKNPIKATCGGSAAVCAANPHTPLRYAGALERPASVSGRGRDGRHGYPDDGRNLSTVGKSDLSVMTRIPPPPGPLLAEGNPALRDRLRVLRSQLIEQLASEAVLDAGLLALLGAKDGTTAQSAPLAATPAHAHLGLLAETSSRFAGLLGSVTDLTSVIYDL